MELRNGLSVQLVSPASGCRRLALPETGSVLCLVLAGVIGEVATAKRYSAGHLHLLRGAPEILDAEALRGRWHAGACELVLSGDGLSGDARATGTCLPGLPSVMRWEVEPEYRQRLSLQDHEGVAVWTGILGSDGTLAGLARQAGRVIFTR